MTGVSPRRRCPQVSVPMSGMYSELCSEAIFAIVKKKLVVAKLCYGNNINLTINTIVYNRVS